MSDNRGPLERLAADRDRQEERAEERAHAARTESIRAEAVREGARAERERIRAWLVAHERMLITGLAKDSHALAASSAVVHFDAAAAATCKPTPPAPQPSSPEDTAVKS